MSAEHEELADDLEREAARLQEQSDKLGGEIDGTRQDWEAKRADAGVPGAEPRREAEEDEAGDGGGDESDAEPKPERE